MNSGLFVSTSSCSTRKNLPVYLSQVPPTTLERGALMNPLYLLLCLAFPTLSPARTPTPTGGRIIPVYLPRPAEVQSLDIFSRGALGVLKTDQGITVLPRGTVFGTVTGFNPAGKTRDQVFGPMVQFQKPTLMTDNDKDHWTNLMLVDQKFMAFDSMFFAWVVMDEKYKQLFRRSVPRDLILPPRDRGGEATKPETQSLRQRFSQAWKQTPSLKAAGISTAFRKIVGSSSSMQPYFVALKLPTFPLALMECQKSEPSQCSLTRQCYLEGTSIPADARAGIAISEKRGLIILGHSHEGSLLGYTFQSCFHSFHSHTWVLPKPLKPITNLMIDDEERLWVTTQEPDDYLNASVYYWPRDQW